MNIENFDFISRRFTPTQYRSIIEGSRCSESDRRVLESALSAFETAYTHDFTDAVLIDSIVKAAMSVRKVVWETGTIMLAQLAQTNAIARLELTKMANDSAAPIRSRAMFYLTDQHRRDYCLELLQAGVRDRSASVAHVASWKAVSLYLHELADAIEARLKMVKKQIVRLELQVTVGLLRDGFHEYHNENGYSIVVAFPDRYPTMVVWPGNVAEGEVHTIGLTNFRKRISESHQGHGTREWRWPNSTNEK